MRGQGAFPAHAACRNVSRQRIKGRMRVPNCSMPITKSSNVSITPRTVDNSSSIAATEAYDPTSTPWLVGSVLVRDLRSHNGTLVGVLSFHDVAKASLRAASFENKLLKQYIKNWPEEGKA